MAIRLIDRYPNRANPANESYPHGSGRNKSSPTAIDGTPFDESRYNDHEGFFQSLLEAAEVTPNNTPDTVPDSQYADALSIVANGLVQIDVGGSTDAVLDYNQARVHGFRLTGTLTGSIDVVVPDTERMYTVVNGTTGDFTVTVKTALGAGVVAGQGQTFVVRCDGVDVVRGVDSQRTNYVGSVSKLVAIADPIDGAHYHVTEYSAGSVYGGGLFYWDADATDAANGGTVLESTALTSGRWKRIHTGGTVYLSWFGGLPNTSAAQALIAAIASAEEVIIEPGEYIIDEPVIVVGSGRQVIRGIQRSVCVLKAGSALDAAEDPIIALSEQYKNNDASTLLNQIDIQEITFQGSVPTENGLASQEIGAYGLDVSWSKDRIRIDRCNFRELKYGIFAIERVLDVSHWGTYVTNCQAFLCYKFIDFYPNYGGVHNCDVQGCPVGIKFNSGAAQAGVLEVTNCRIEANYPAKPASITEDIVGIESSGRLTVSGTYFEGYEYGIKILGGGNSCTSVIGGKISIGAKAGIYWGAVSSQSNLTLMNLYMSENFMEFSGPDPVGVVLIHGSSSNNYKLFGVNGAWQSRPPETLTYMSYDPVRGNTWQLEGVEVNKGPWFLSGELAARTKSDTFPLYKREYLERVSNATNGQSLVTIAQSTGIASAEVTISLDRYGSFGTYKSKWTVIAGENGYVAQELYELATGSSYEPDITFNDATGSLVATINNTSYDTFYIEVSIMSEQDPSALITF